MIYVQQKLFSCNYMHMGIISSRWLYVHSVPTKSAVPVGPCMYICMLTCNITLELLSTKYKNPQAHDAV